MLERYSKDAAVMTIGPAGEMLYNSAAIMVSEFRTGHPCRAAGRGGLGALMGSKKLKGIVIEKAVKKPEFEYADKEKFDSARAKYIESANASAQVKSMREVGSLQMMNVTVPLGIIPHRNFSGLPLDEEKKQYFNSTGWKDAATAYGGKTGMICHPGCLSMCSNVYNGKDGKFRTAGFEYEAVAMLGPNLAVYDFYDIAGFDYQCDDIGMDAIETGCIIGVCMEGGKLEWGDVSGVNALFDEMRSGTEFGRIMGAGTATVGKYLGVKRIPVVKGQGIPAYDPRGFRGNGITYSVSTQGADHTWGMLPNPAATDDVIPDMVFESIINTAIQNDFICTFASFPIRADPSIVPDAYAGIFGGEWSAEKLRDMAKETIRIERMFNEAAGFTAEDDRLPDFFRQPEPEFEGALPPFPYSDELVRSRIETIHKYND